MPAPLRLRLYVAAEALHSAHALSNLREVLHTHFPGRHHLEVVDVMLHPERALADGVLLTPTLLRLDPPLSPPIIGDLHDTPLLLRALGLGAR